MSAMNDQTRINFYASSPEPCGYLSDRQSISAFANPYVDMDADTYNNLIQFGFRRSGGYLYRPHCPDCTACISLRVRAEEHRPSRNDRKNLRRNADIELQVAPAKFSEEHFDLYRRYVNTRHADGSMANPSRSDYHRFLICDWAETRFIEFRLGRRLLGVAVTDVTESGLSAVYTFFDPDERERSLGHFAILSQIGMAREQGYPYLYLGYWIADCDKMRYKSRYRPAEIFLNDQWVELDSPDH
jgi:arginine-tRNA-protein transferase